ncbi:MAG: hypothetical protein AAB674_02785 [Patescibacteria group bacterium]
MTKEVYRSKCCNAKVKASGIPDFLGSNDVCTVNYVCLKCNKSCDVVASKGQKQKVCVEKSGMIKLSVNDDIEIRLTREGRRIYKEYRKKYIHDPFKKTNGRWVRGQLSEFMYIFGSRMFMGANAVIVANVIRIFKS